MTNPLIITCPNSSVQIAKMSAIVKAMREGYEYGIYNTVKMKFVSLHKSKGTAQNFIELNKKIVHYRIIKLSTVVYRVEK